ncbi:peptidylprolyl isomerase [Granulicella cerasi]|uniref:peptidylprolyl isomerase n=1 Tax=Granulicella cerasi TaxID=741063 RepID=A0ABW1ZBF1_9BACT|nr:peptidylprolyl isomerase [Granulicella cerasi]
MKRFASACLLSLTLASAAVAQHVASHTAHKPAEPQPTGPTAVFDTTMGRITCKLYAKEMPATTANFIALAEGRKPWMDPFTGKTMSGTPYFDATSILGITGGVSGGDRVGSGKGYADDPTPTEKAGVSLLHDGLLGIRLISDGTQQTASGLIFQTHANLEMEHRMLPFGLCDAASIEVIRKLQHALLMADNRPAEPVAIDHVSIVPPGRPLPAVAPHAAAASIVPQFPPQPAPAVAPPEPTGPTAVIDTTMGAMRCKLFTQTTVATENFIGLAEGKKDWKHPITHQTMHDKPFYNGVHFARVIPDFMVQQSDVPGGAADGDIGFTFANEIIPGISFDRPGRLAYANDGPTTNNSQFFITSTPEHRLDGNYTIFGQCDADALKVVDAISSVPRDAHHKPLKPITVRSITIVP